MQPSNVTELSRELRSSIEVTRNAKGDYQWVVKRYYENGEWEEAQAEILAIDTMLRSEYLPQ